MQSASAFWLIIIHSASSVLTIASKLVLGHEIEVDFTLIISISKLTTIGYDALQQFKLLWSVIVCHPQNRRYKCHAEYLAYFKNIFLAWLPSVSTNNEISNNSKQISNYQTIQIFLSNLLSSQTVDWKYLIQTEK